MKKELNVVERAELEGVLGQGILAVGVYSSALRVACSIIGIEPRDSEGNVIK